MEKNYWEREERMEDFFYFLYVFAKWNGRWTWEVWIKCLDGEAKGWRYWAVSYHFPQFINSHGHDLMTLLPTSTLPLISLLKIIDPFEETNQPFQKSHQNLYVSREYRERERGWLLEFYNFPFRNGARVTQFRFPFSQESASLFLHSNARSSVTHLLFLLLLLPIPFSW